MSISLLVLVMSSFVLGLLFVVLGMSWLAGEREYIMAWPLGAAN